MSLWNKLSPRCDFQLINPVVKRNFEKPNDSQVDELISDLGKLVNILGEDNWYLTGGFALQLGLKDFYRTPGNVNLSVPLDKLRDLSVRAEEHGYCLVSRKWCNHYGDKKHETYLKPVWQEIDKNKTFKLSSTTSSNLRFVRFDRKAPFSKQYTPVENRDFLDYIDVHPFYLEEKNNSIIPKLNGRYLMSIDEKEGGLAVREELTAQDFKYNLTVKDEKDVEGKKVNVRGLPYIQRIKEWLVLSPNQAVKNKKFHWYDLGKIYHFQNKGFDDFCNVWKKSGRKQSFEKVIGISSNELKNLWEK